MASLYEGSGTITTDTTTDEVICRGWVTVSAHLDTGSGTWTWQFRGPDGVWRSIYGGTSGITEQAFTASHMANFFFGGDVRVRGSASASASVQWDWQIIGNVENRG